MNKSKFAIDDEVRLKSNNDLVGLVKQVVSVLSNGNTLYLVEFPQGKKMVAERDMEINKEEVQVLNNISLVDLSVAIEVDDKINEIINELKLTKSTHPATILVNACKLQRYLISTCTVTKKYVGAKSNSVLYNELYNGLILGDRNFITNTIIFTEIMKRLEAVVHNVALIDSKNKFYMANLLLIENEYYYFDVTLDTEVYLDANQDDELVLCCAGVGKKKYEKYFKPLSIMDLDPNVPNAPLPNNISLDDIEQSLINSIK